MLKIYHVRGTRSIRVIWACEELALPYEVIPVDFSSEFRSSPQWRALNPVGKVPVMIDGDLTVFESGAMVQYLIDAYGDGRLQPAIASPEHAIYLQWGWFAESTFARPLGEIVNHRRAFTQDEQNPAAITEMQGRAQLCLDAVDGALAGREYIAGNEFSGADIMLVYTLKLADALLSGAFPSRAAEYWQRLSARPGYKVAAVDN